jgi:hypothetical protein
LEKEDDNAMVEDLFSDTSKMPAVIPSHMANNKPFKTKAK